MKKLAILLLMIFMLTGCRSGNGASKPLPSDLSSSANEEAIFIRPKELTLFVGETASLVCKTESEQTVSDVNWAVEDEKIAAISSDGVVTAIAEGETTATASRQNDFANVQAKCHIIVSKQKMLAIDRAKIEINDKMENVIAQDGTNCTMIFEMQAESTNGVFKGRAMLQSIGVKDAGGSIPATGMLGLVSKTEFTLEPANSETQSADNEVNLAPLVKVDYRGEGTFHFIMTDVGFMALEMEVEDDGMFLDVPFEVTVTGDKVGISFNSPDGQLLSFQGKILK
jgi:hypothetical protein